MSAESLASPQVLQLLAIVLGVLTVETSMHHMPHFVEQRRAQLAAAGARPHPRLVEFRMFDGYLAHVYCFALASGAIHAYIKHEQGPEIWLFVGTLLGICFSLVPIAFRPVHPSRDHDVERDRRKLAPTRIGKFALNLAAATIFVFGMYQILSGGHQ